jgi:hypothetical protein
LSFNENQTDRELLLTILSKLDEQSDQKKLILELKEKLDQFKILLPQEMSLREISNLLPNKESPNTIRKYLIANFEPEVDFYSKYDGGKIYVKQDVVLQLRRHYAK